MPPDAGSSRLAAPVADEREHGVMTALAGFFDTAWYRERYPDVASAELEPLRHFVRHGAAERRDPNRFFDSAWYAEHYPDVAASGLNPLLHYLTAGAGELRNPHPRFDAVYYADQHPEAAVNPLLFHLRVGLGRGYLTEQPVHIDDYLPSSRPPLPIPENVVADVIIPVYRGLRETRCCIRSVLATRGPAMGRIIVIEDRSPDAALVDWLQRLAAAGRVTLLRNRRNLGFVVSVNRGMQAAGTNDVVLLNSDTEVPPGWLERMAAQAYGEPRIASVSPFSNNATICGYPDNAGGPMALGHSVQQINAVCEIANRGRWVSVPTTVGFCMYIRREALRETGPFDAERFKLGYGEENDFCLRAAALGWRHRLACDTFVYHRGAVSFGDQAQHLTAAAATLLHERFPGYARSITHHIGLGGIVPYRFTLTAGLFRQSGLPVILMISHDLGGGVRRHIDKLVQRYIGAARILLLEATPRGATLSVPALPSHPTLTLPAERVGDLAAYLRSANLSRVHVHHLIGMDMDIHELIQRLDVPFDVTVHDYFAICPQTNLLPWPDGVYCGEPGAAACNGCIATRPSHGARDILSWRAAYAWQFNDADRVLCPSNDVIARLQRHGLAQRAVFAPHEPVAAGRWRQRVPPAPATVLRVVVLGVLADHKGARTVAAVAEAADPRSIEIQLIGHTESNFPAPALRRMKVTGAYEDADLGQLIEQAAPHVIWFPAAWPETFSYTLNAAIASGLPIAASRIGAFPERLAGRPMTWMADATTSPAGWVEVFATIRTALLGRKRSASPMREKVADFYQDAYLSPEPPRPHAVRSRPRDTGFTPVIMIVPERFPGGQPTPCAYIRLLEPLDHPAIASGFDVRVTDASMALQRQADIILTQRNAIADVAGADALAEHARRTGATLLYDLDDDLVNIPRDHPDAKMLRPLTKTVRRMLLLADRVWLSTDGLVRRLASIRADAVVVGNGLDERIWTPPADHAGWQDAQVRVLCMGTSTHDADFAMILPALVRLKAEFGDRVVIDLLGMTSQNDLPPGIERIGAPIHASRSYPGFVQWLTSTSPRWHIGLAPLLDSPFNRSKSPIKAMDYAALGMFVLASDMPVYQGSVADGPAGELVPNHHHAWYAALSRLLRDPARRRLIASRSRAALLSGSTLASQAESRRAAWRDVLAIHAQRSSSERSLGRSLLGIAEPACGVAAQV